MFEKPSKKERLKSIFERYRQPRIPANHLSIKDVGFILLVNIPEGGIKHKEEMPNGKISYDAFTDGKTLTYGFYFEENGMEYKSEVKARRISANTLEITDLVLNNQVQPLKSPQEIYAVLNYMGNVYRGARKDRPLHADEKLPFTRPLYRAVSRLQFSILRGL